MQWFSEFPAVLAFPHQVSSWGKCRNQNFFRQFENVKFYCSVKTLTRKQVSCDKSFNLNMFFPTCWCLCIFSSRLSEPKTPEKHFSKSKQTEIPVKFKNYCFTFQVVTTFFLLLTSWNFSNECQKPENVRNPRTPRERQQNFYLKPFLKGVNRVL